MKISIKFNEKKDYLYLLITFILICFGSNTLTTQTLLSTQLSAYLIFALACTIFFFKNKFKIRVSRTVALVVTYMIVSILFTCTIRLDFNNFNGYVLVLMKIMSAFLILKSLDINSLLKAFSEIICTISLYSLVVTYIFPIFSLERLFPIVVNSQGVRFFNAFLTYKIDASGLFGIRNYGIFSEPAVYCLYLFIAALIIYAVKDITMQWCTKLCLLAATLISTCSPIGLITASVIFLLMIVKLWNKVKYRKIFNRLILYAIVLLIIVFTNDNMVNAVEYIVGKITISSGTGMGRIQAILMNLDMWLTFPLFGGGLRAITEVAALLNFNTSTTSAFLLGFGLIFTVVITVMQYKSIRFILQNHNKFVVFVFFILFMLQINNHAFIQGDWFWLFTMIGLVVSKNETFNIVM